MPINRYGVWCARARKVSAETDEMDPKSPHIHLYYEDGQERQLRASINVKSASAISELALYKIETFQHPLIDQLEQLSLGYHPLGRTPNSLALDYLRGNLVKFEEGLLLPHDIPGRENDLLDLIMPVLQRAVDMRAKVYLFGEPYDDDLGIHNIHMNQGSTGRFAKYNGIWQDGGVIIKDQNLNRYVALFLAFGSQAIHTDEQTGDALPGSQTIADLLTSTGLMNKHLHGAPQIMVERRVVIIGALVTPSAAENQPGGKAWSELVYLFNRGDSVVSLGGWRLLNRGEEAHVLSQDICLAPGEVRAVSMSAAPLSNHGGLITLLDAAGLKVDGVSYTREQAQPEGQIILF